jgi:hypothetical protein
MYNADETAQLMLNKTLASKGKQSIGGYISKGNYCPVVYKFGWYRQITPIGYRKVQKTMMFQECA